VTEESLPYQHACGVLKKDSLVICFVVAKEKKGKNEINKTAKGHE